MTKRNVLSSRRAFHALFLCLCIGLLNTAAAQTRTSNPTPREHADGPAGTPCDSERALPCDRTPPHLIGLPDPTRWSVSGRGFEAIYYRRATAKERAANGWGVGTYLVAGGGAVDATRGATQATLAIPLDDRTVQRVAFVLDERVEGLQFIERVGVPGSPNGEVVSRRLTPVLFEYFNAGFDPQRPRPVNGAWAKIVSSDDGGLYATGLAQGLEFEIDGPGGGWDLDSLPVPNLFKLNPDEIVKVQILSLGAFGGSQYGACDNGFSSEACGWICAEMIGAPCDNNPHTGPGANHHCADSSDNDADGTTDTGDADCVEQDTADYDWGDSVHPGYPRRNWESGNSFALFGDGRFCTQYAEAQFNDSGHKISGNWINRLTEMGWASEALLNQAVGWQGVTGREKQFRYLAGGCWIFESPEAAHDCAFDGSSCLSGYPYADAGVTASNYYDAVWDDVHHGTHWGLDDALHIAQVVYWGGPDDGPSEQMFCDDGDSCCGAAPDSNDPTQWGSSVVQYQNGCSASITSAHEMGHASGLDHVDITSFMHDPSYNDPALPAAQKALLVGCVESASCPRPSGFRYHPF